MKTLTTIILLALASPLAAQEADTLAWGEQQLEEVQVKRNRQTIKRMGGPQTGFEMNKDELFRAACCNLGESFQNNPSVDVNYSDATTGAKQIKLLGLSGTYVQMLTEMQPNFFGAAKPFALGYVPGPWMKSISVSKGASTVKNAFDGITGQINVQYLQPEDEEGVTVNLYGDDDSRVEANADANVHITKNLATEVLAHYDENWGGHDDNGDSFMDKPNVRQFNLQNRWYYGDSHYIFHGGISGLKEDRTFGQTTHHAAADRLWTGAMNTKRVEGYMKHAFILDKDYDTNIAWMTNFAVHNQDNSYGDRFYNVEELDLTSQLMVESKLDSYGSISVGSNYEYHKYDVDRLFSQDELGTQSDRDKGYKTNNDKFGSIGVYGQYTFNMNNKLVAMLGVRCDLASETVSDHSIFFTPRLHVKYQINDHIQARVSGGKGYRLSDMFWAENTYLLATGRTLSYSYFDRESAWNYGGSLGFDIPLWGRNLKVNAEYFYTWFKNQIVIDYDTDPTAILVYDLHSWYNGDGKSFSHVIQVDATYEPLPGMTATLAFRRNIVKTTYMGVLMDKALSSKFKGLLSLSYKPGLGLWQFDGSLQLNGPARLPKSSISDGTEYTPVYPQLSLQVTRWFRHFSIYAGGENLTNYKQKNAVIGYDDPFGTNFDATQVWAPIHGRMLYAGIRVNIGRL